MTASAIGPPLAEEALLGLEAGEFARTFETRVAAARGLEARAVLLQEGVGLGRRLLRRREAGVPIGDEVLGSVLDALDAACGLMIELLPPDPPRPR